MQRVQFLISLQALLKHLAGLFQPAFQRMHMRQVVVGRQLIRVAGNQLLMPADGFSPTVEFNQCQTALYGQLGVALNQIALLVERSQRPLGTTCLSVALGFFQQFSGYWVGMGNTHPGSRRAQQRHGKHKGPQTRHDATAYPHASTVSLVASCTPRDCMACRNALAAASKPVTGLMQSVSSTTLPSLPDGR